MSDERSEFFQAVYEPILNTIIWNAPDHEHTLYQVRGWIEQALTEAFLAYEMGGGDRANVASHLLTDTEKAAADARQEALNG